LAREFGGYGFDRARGAMGFCLGFLLLGPRTGRGGQDWAGWGQRFKKDFKGPFPGATDGKIHSTEMVSSTPRRGEKFPKVGALFGWMRGRVVWSGISISVGQATTGGPINRGCQGAALACFFLFFQERAAAKGGAARGSAPKTFTSTGFLFLCARGKASLEGDKKKSGIILGLIFFRFGFSPLGCSTLEKVSRPPGCVRAGYLLGEALFGRFGTKPAGFRPGFPVQGGRRQKIDFWVEAPGPVKN